MMTTKIDWSYLEKKRGDYQQEFLALTAESGIVPKPLGYNMVVRVMDVEEKTEGGIVLPSELKDKLQDGHDIGMVVSFGPTCYEGFKGCEGPADWGVKRYDFVEFKRYDGKPLRFEEFENYKSLADSDIHMVYSRFEGGE